MKFASALALVAYAATAVAFAPVAPQRHSAALHMSVVLDKSTGKSALDPAVIAKYGSLPFPKDKILAEYVWVDADGNTRSKTRTLPAAKV
jgi:glutamine synthetase